MITKNNFYYNLTESAFEIITMRTFLRAFMITAVENNINVFHSIYNDYYKTRYVKLPNFNNP